MYMMEKKHRTTHPSLLLHYYFIITLLSTLSPTSFYRL